MKRLIFLMMVLLGLGGTIVSHGLSTVYAQEPRVAVVEINETIQPLTVRFFERVHDAAVQEGAVVLLVLLDTPGGLFDPTRDIVEGILISDVPVVVYVSPSGAEATSAGAFIAAAGHVAAMAPATSIGTGVYLIDDGNDAPIPSLRRDVQSAAALMRAIAQERGRDAAALEDTVLKAASYTATEALEAGIVDLISPDVTTLLTELDGRIVHLRRGDVVLETKGVHTWNVDQTPLEQFLRVIANPNVAFLLLALGGLGIFIEVLSPGLVGPGVFGVVALLLSFVGLGNLPVNWVGVGFLVLSLLMLILEVQTHGFGVFGIAGVVSFGVGSFLLFGGLTSPPIHAPGLRANIFLMLGVTASMGGIVLFVARDVFAARRIGAQINASSGSSLVGQIATVTDDLRIHGTVYARGEHWSAFTESEETIPLGSEVKVVAVEGLHLRISPVPAGSPELVTMPSSGNERSLIRPIANAATVLKLRPRSKKETGYIDGLTHREVEVLRVVAQGKTNPEIAEALFISLNTVTRHLTNIYAKTNTNNRTEAAFYAARHNLLDVSEE